jgi:hypothetical protein
MPRPLFALRPFDGRSWHDGGKRSAQARGWKPAVPRHRRRPGLGSRQPFPQGRAQTTRIRQISYVLGRWTTPYVEIVRCALSQGSVNERLLQIYVGYQPERQQLCSKADFLRPVSTSKSAWVPVSQTKPKLMQFMPAFLLCMSDERARYGIAVLPPSKVHLSRTHSNHHHAAIEYSRCRH